MPGLENSAKRIHSDAAPSTSAQTDTPARNPFMAIFPKNVKAAMGLEPCSNSERRSHRPWNGLPQSPLWRAHDMDGVADRLGGALVAFGAAGHISFSQ